MFLHTHAQHEERHLIWCPKCINYQLSPVFILIINMESGGRTASIPKAECVWCVWASGFLCSDERTCHEHHTSLHTSLALLCTMVITASYHARAFNGRNWGNCFGFGDGTFRGCQAFVQTEAILIVTPVHLLGNANIWHMWSRGSFVLHHVHQNEEEMWSVWLSLWNDCWCQTGWFPYLCWSPVTFTHHSI